MIDPLCRICRLGRRPGYWPCPNPRCVESNPSGLYYDAMNDCWYRAREYTGAVPAGHDWYWERKP